MELLSSLRRVLDSLAGSLADLISGQIVDPFRNDSSYRTGFIWGLITALVIGLASQQILYWWNRILQFFAPTKTPATSPGPSPITTARGCFFAGLILFLLLVLFIIVFGKLISPSD